MNRRPGGSLDASGLYRYLPLLLAVLHLLVLVLVVVATPTDVFQPRRLSGFSTCASMFGWKPCGAHSVSADFECGIASIMSAAAAFAIISILLAATAFVVLVLSAFDVFKRPLVVLVVDGVASLTMLISWGCVAGAFNQGTCAILPRGSISYTYNYGASFGLMVAAWALELVAIVGLLFLPM
ncbi:Amastin surface glycoprotein [Novymonas esmeraldas]|uniref:Amastin surface glycoprotein n=1 Tax=Novymonas esmeraldas TaxID=1808958 RepID=A0AAW0EL62_9TRYP